MFFNIIMRLLKLYQIVIKFLILNLCAQKIFADGVRWKNILHCFCSCIHFLFSYSSLICSYFCFGIRLFAVFLQFTPCSVPIFLKTVKMADFWAFFAHFYRFLAQKVPDLRGFSLFWGCLL